MNAAATTTRARARADYLASLAPAGARVEITEERTDSGFEIAQVTIRGSIDIICLTIGGRGNRRTRLTARTWFTSGGHDRQIAVRHVAYRIRNLFV